MTHTKQRRFSEQTCRLTQALRAVYPLPCFGRRIRAFTTLAVTAFALVLLTTPARSLAATSPVVSYNLDAGAGTSLADQSSNNYPGTLVNGPVWTAGRYSGGLAFDGVNDYVTMGDVGQADGLTAITVSTWVKFAVNGGAPYETHFIDKSQCNGVAGSGPWELGASLFGTHKAEFVIYPQRGNPSAYVASGSSAKSIDDGAWHYVTGRYDGTTLSIWVDGTLENSKAVSGLTMSNTSSSVELGGHCNGAAYPFKGTLDDVRVYDRALTSSEILADMTTAVGSGAPAPADTTAPSTPTGLSTSAVTTSQVTLSWQASTDNVGVAGYRVYRDGSFGGTTSATSFTNSGLASNTSYAFTVAAYDAAGNSSSQSAQRSVTTSAAASGGTSPLAAYSFDAGAGASLADQSGNSHAGTLVNGPVWTAGRYNGGLAFDGVNDYVTMGDVGQADGLTAITVSTWVKFAGATSSETHLVDKSQCNGASGSGPWELGAGLFGAHKAEFVIYPQGGSPSAYIASGPSAKSIDDGAWHYVTGRYDGTNLSVWVDGNLENSKAVSGFAMSNTSSSVEFGGHCNGAGYPFKGSLDDVRIYARALTSSEILADMSTPVSGGAPPSPPPADTTAPSTPMGLSASGVTSSQVTLSWQASTDNVGVTGYRVYRDGSPAGTTSSTSYTNSGLASNTSYVFTVAAFDAAGSISSQSAPLGATTSATRSSGYTTNFNQTENPISESGRWINGGTNGLDWSNVSTTPGLAIGHQTGASYTDATALLTGTWAADQSATATVHTVNQHDSCYQEVELRLRSSISAHSNKGYEIGFKMSQTADAYLIIVRWNGPVGSFDYLVNAHGSQFAIKNGDVVKAEIVGNVIKAYVNGVQKGQADITSIGGTVYSSGNPGMGFNLENSQPGCPGTNGDYGFTSYSATG